MRISRVLIGSIIIIAIFLPLASVRAQDNHETFPTIGDFEQKAYRTHDPDGIFETEIYGKRDQIANIRMKLEAVIEMKMPIPVIEAMSEAEIRSFLLIETDGKYRSTTTQRTEKIYNNWTPAYSEDSRLKVLEMIRGINLNGNLSKTEMKLKQALEIQEIEDRGKGIHIMELMAIRNMLKEMENEQSNVQKIYFKELKTQNKMRENAENERKGRYVLMAMIAVILIAGGVIGLSHLRKKTNQRHNKKND